MAKSEHRYEIILYWSEEDEAYIAEVPELAGCAADGPSYQDAIANAGWSSTSGSRRPRSWAARFRSPRVGG